MASNDSTILIPVDFSEASEHALTRGLELAERLGATVQLIHVAPKMKPLFPSCAANRRAAARLAKEEGNQAREMLKKLQARSELIVRTRVLRGVAHEQIAAYADQIDAELIVVGTIGHSLAGTVLLGSTTERVLRNTSTPTVVVPMRRKTSTRPRRKRAARRA